MATVVVTANCGNTITVPEPFELTMHIEGSVTDVGTNTVLENALIEVRTTTTGVLFAEAMSDSTGNYALSFLYRYFLSDRNFCPFAYFASAPGYATELRPVDCIEELQTVDFQLQPF